MSDSVKIAEALVSFTAMVNDGKLMKDLRDATAAAKVNMAALADLNTRAAELARKEKELNRSSDAARSLLDADRRRLEQEREDLERDKARHADRVAKLDADRAAYDEKIKAYQHFASFVDDQRR